MKHLKLTETTSEFESLREGGNLVEPWVVLTKDNMMVHMPNTTKEVNYVYMSYGYSLDEQNNGTRLDYVGEYEYKGKTYYKFAYSYIDEGKRITSTDDDWGFVLFESRNFTKLTFPYSMEVLQGYDYGEGEVDIYPFVNEWSNIELHGFANVVSDNDMVIIGHRTDIGTNANGKAYVDLGLTSGTLWATMNVGANSATDYGQYFQWGDIVDKSNAVCDWSTCKYSNGNGTEFTKYNTGLHDIGGTIDNKLTLDLSDDTARANMGGDWKMPSLALMQELVQETNSEWVENYNHSGVNGRLFTSKTNGNSIFVPAAGGRWYDSFDTEGGDAFLWSSSLDGAYPGGAWYLGFYSDAVYLDRGDRYYGFSVRGVL